MTGSPNGMPGTKRSRPALSRLPELDLLRSMAVLTVILHHWDKHPPENSLVFKPLHLFFDFFWRLGWNGVDLFFVLSGFLVSGLLYREYKRKGSVRISRFFTRRGLKIYPAFYVFILISILVDQLLEPTFVGRKILGPNLLGELLFLQNYIGKMWGHTWSLAVEEHFYLLLGLYVYFLSRRKNGDSHDLFRSIVTLFAVVALGCLVLRFATCIWIKPITSEAHMFPTHLRIDSLLFGVLLSYFYNMHHERMKQWVRKWRWMLILLSPPLVLSCFFIQNKMFLCTLGLTFTYLGYGGLLLIVLFRIIRAPVPLKRPLLFVALIGSYSYSIYLWHIPMLWLAKLVPAFYPSLALYIGGCFIAGCGMAKIVELPVLRLRDKLFPSESGVLAPESSEINRLDHLRMALARQFYSG